MGRIGAYFLAQLKRMLRCLPRQMAVTFCICACVGALAGLLVSGGIFDAGATRYRIGMVGDLSDSYLGFGLQALQTMDDSRLMIELVGMPREEAEEAFARGELYAVMYVPEGLMESVVSGDNDRLITYTATQGQKGLGAMVMGEIVDIASTLVTRSQSAIYAMQRILAEEGRSEEIGWETDRLNLKLIQLVLARSGFSDVEILGYAEGLSMEMYYFCRGILLILLLLGLLNSALFAGKPAARAGFLRARGVGALWQILGEYLAYLCLVFLQLLCIGGLLIFAQGKEWIVLPEWAGAGTAVLADFLCMLLPAAAMFAALQFLLYELAGGIVNGILLQFLLGIGMGYLSGYFYPAAFFPERMRLLGSVLPTGVAADYVGAGLLREIPGIVAPAVFAYLAAFLLLAVMRRRSRIERG